MKDLINNKWREDNNILYPNLLLYADGTVTIMNVLRLYNPDDSLYKMMIKPTADTTLESIMKYEEAPWCSTDIWCELQSADNIYVGGSMGMGHEGFIAKLDKNRKLLWAHSFDYTNPIRELILNDNKLIGITEHDESYIMINNDNLVDVEFVNKRYKMNIME